MLKIVPDPPHNHHSLEDTLVQATEYALCAQAVAHQAISVQQPVARVDSDHGVDA